MFTFTISNCGEADILGAGVTPLPSGACRGVAISDKTILSAEGMYSLSITNTAEEWQPDLIINFGEGEGTQRIIYGDRWDFTAAFPITISSEEFE